MFVDAAKFESSGIGTLSEDGGSYTSGFELPGLYALFLELERDLRLFRRLPRLVKKKNKFAFVRRLYQNPSQTNFCYTEQSLFDRLNRNSPS